MNLLNSDPGDEELTDPRERGSLQPERQLSWGWRESHCREESLKRHQRLSVMEEIELTRSVPCGRGGIEVLLALWWCAAQGPLR